MSGLQFRHGLTIGLLLGLGGALALVAFTEPHGPRRSESAATEENRCITAGGFAQFDGVSGFYTGCTFKGMR